MPITDRGPTSVEPPGADVFPCTPLPAPARSPQRGGRLPLATAAPRDDLRRHGGCFVGALRLTTILVPRARRRVTPEDYRKLVEAGVVDKIELLNETVFIGRHPMVFSPAQAAAAARLGVKVPTAVDAVLNDPGARAELATRLAANQGT